MSVGHSLGNNSSLQVSEQRCNCAVCQAVESGKVRKAERRQRGSGRVFFGGGGGEGEA